MYVIDYGMHLGFSLVYAGSPSSSPSVDCVMLPSFHCEDWDCCLPLVLGYFLVSAGANIFWVAAELFWPR